MIGKKRVLESHCTKRLFKKYVRPSVAHLLVKCVFLGTMTGLETGMPLYSFSLEKSNADEVQLFTSGRPMEDWDQKWSLKFHFMAQSQGKFLCYRGTLHSDSNDY